MSELFVYPGSTGPGISQHTGSTSENQVSIFYEEENIRLRSVGQMPADLIQILKSKSLKRGSGLIDLGSGARNDCLFQYAYLLADVLNGYLALVLGQECFVQRLGPLVIAWLVACSYPSPHRTPLKSKIVLMCHAWPSFPAAPQSRLLAWFPAQARDPSSSGTTFNGQPLAPRRPTTISKLSWNLMKQTVLGSWWPAGLLGWS